MSKHKKISKRKAAKVSVAPMPDHWDMGAKGPANRIGLVQEPVTWTNDKGEQVNPNNVKRMRREDAIDEYLKRGWLSQAQHGMAVRLITAFEGTQRTAPAIKKVQVDSSPKPDAHVAIMIDRITKLTHISKRIPPESLYVMRRVLYDGKTIEEYTGGSPMEVINAAAALSFGLHEMARAENENL